MSERKGSLHGSGGEKMFAEMKVMILMRILNRVACGPPWRELR